MNFIPKNIEPKFKIQDAYLGAYFQPSITPNRITHPPPITKEKETSMVGKLEQSPIVEHADKVQKNVSVSETIVKPAVLYNKESEIKLDLKEKSDFVPTSVRRKLNK